MYNNDYQPVCASFIKNVLLLLLLADTIVSFVNGFLRIIIILHPTVLLYIHMAQFNDIIMYYNNKNNSNLKPVVFFIVQVDDDG